MKEYTSKHLGDLYIIEVYSSTKPYRARWALRRPKDETNISILQHMISGIPLVVGLGTRM